MIPSLYAFALLALAAFRSWVLLARDDITKNLRQWMFLRTGGVVNAARSAFWWEFVQCPWCFGFWIAIAWYIAWLIWATGALVLAVPFALSAVVALIEEHRDSD